MDGVLQCFSEVFVDRLIPAFCSVLGSSKGPPLVPPASEEPRRVILEIIQKIPTAPCLEEHAVKLLDSLLKVLEIDNEANAFSAIRVIFKVHKAFRPKLDDSVPELLGTIRKMYAEVPAQFEDAIEGGSAPRFRVITEFPLVILFLLRVYPDHIQAQIPKLIPPMVSMLGLSLPDNVARVKWHHEFVCSQVKTLTFITYLLDSFLPSIQKHGNSIICDSVVRLLHISRGESLATRRDLLVSIRHILATDYRAVLFTKIDELLANQFLLGGASLGAGLESLRPLAFSTVSHIYRGVLDSLPAQ